MNEFIESSEPLLDEKNNKKAKVERKKRGKVSETIKTKSLSCLNLNFYYQEDENEKQKDPKTIKIETKFLFKIFFHLFCQFIFIILMLIILFNNETMNHFLSNSNNLFLFFIIFGLITFIVPIFSEKIINIFPYNYIYLSIFTLIISYFTCKVLIFLNSSTIIISVILFSSELIVLGIDSYLIEKDKINKINSIIFSGVCLVFIGLFYYFIKKIQLYKIFLIIIIILIIGYYLIYDMNLILSEKKKKFRENDYVPATLFIYSNIIPTMFEFCDSFESRRKPIKKHKGQKTMIYTGDESYERLYNQKDDEENNNEDDEKKTNTLLPKRRNTDVGRKLRLSQNNIIKEVENENDSDDKEDEKDNENSLLNNNDTDISFKNQSGQKLEFENEIENEN
jgi:FtsH-binding integral membrane protein